MPTDNSPTRRYILGSLVLGVCSPFAATPFLRPVYARSIPKNPAYVAIDGSRKAPLSPQGPQYPLLLDGYVVRPPWNVAGVDYPVGISTSAYPLKDPQVSPPPGTVYSRGKLIVTRDAVTIDGYDFSTNKGVTVYCEKDGLTIRNCKFGGAEYLVTITTGVIDFRGKGLTISYCHIDGGATKPYQEAGYQGLVWLLPAGDVAGDVIFQYNWCTGAPSEVLGMGGGNLDFQFNLLDNIPNCRGGHMNYLQWGGTAASAVVQFNTARQLSNNNGGEGWQFAGSRGQPLMFRSKVCQYNTIIAAGPSPGATMSFLFHGESNSQTATEPTGELGNNYFDITGAYGAWYGKTMTTAAGWKLTANNYNMVSGFVDNPQ